jgi:hypothetical protein
VPDADFGDAFIFDVRGRVDWGRSKCADNFVHLRGWQQEILFGGHQAWRDTGEAEE